MNGQVPCHTVATELVLYPTRPLGVSVQVGCRTLLHGAFPVPLLAVIAYNAPQPRRQAITCGEVIALRCIGGCSNMVLSAMVSNGMGFAY